MQKTFTRTLLLGAGTLLLTSHAAFSQFILSAEIRPRAELRNGFKTVRTSADKPAAFVEQRSRLSANYTHDKLQMRMTVQDVRIWGSTSQVYKSDPSLFNVYEAYGEYRFLPRFSVRAGRQALEYDNARFFGSLDWAQQGRSHDAVKFVYADTTGFTVHAGTGFNQPYFSEPTKLFNTYYTGIDNYKTMQYVWWHKDWVNAKVSGLFSNDGRQRTTDSTTYYRQTYGVVAERKLGTVALGGEFYYQAGANAAGSKIRAYLAAFNATFATKLTPLTLGVDYLSGSGARDSRDRAFVPLYGTNHAFYGHMDYFYVASSHGQNGRTAGLLDAYLKTSFKLSPKTNLLAHAHLFESPAAVYKTANSDEKLGSRLGEELDLLLNTNVSPEFNLKAGYSHLLATSSLDALKNRPTGKANNQWAWVMLTFKPVLFQH